jgi:hypothetical protein
VGSELGEVGERQPWDDHHRQLLLPRRCSRGDGCNNRYEDRKEERSGDPCQVQFR